MADTYSQIYIQIVFAVKNRLNLIHQDWKNDLYKYITGICTKHEQKLIAINGMPDHVHILVGLRPTMAVSELVQHIKANSSRFINSQNWLKSKFYWQEGFGAFSYGQSQLDAVAKYIANQEIHHTKKTFKEEYFDFLKKFQIEYDEKYLFDWL
jgi:REP element-mobilizing transposase RayT